jgi:predicted outer membrane repeat protein
MKKQMQERPGTWRLVIGSVLILCAQVGLAAAQDVSSATGYDIVAAIEQELLIAQLDNAGGANSVAAAATSPRTIGLRAVGPVPSGSAGRVFNTRLDPADPTSFYESIQAAIDDANDGDVILVETLAGGNTVYRERIDFKGKAITLRSGSIDDPDNPAVYPETTFLVGDVSAGSVVTFANDEGPETVLMGLTIGWGTADEGGGIAIEDASPTIRECIITNNQAKYYGGGIDCLGGAATIVNCLISDNEVTGITGVGGGINCQNAAPMISDCTIRNNSSMSLGGGVGCYEASPVLTNCFLINNSAVYGSGQMDLEDASPTITNCTIVVDEEPPGDGGIWCSGLSDPVITNCILWGNGDDLFDCFARYSCIEDGDVGEGNVQVDPQLVEGPLGVYYLSQIEAGQSSLSPCVGAADPATEATLAEHLRTMTTRTDGVADANAVDMGAHYDVAEPVLYPLTVTIMAVDGTGAPIDPNGSVGTIDPNSGSFREFSTLELTAQPAEGYRLKQWLTTTGGTMDPDATIALPVNGPISMIAVFEQIPMYELRTSVEGGHGNVEPDHRRGQLYADGTVVTLEAIPAGGHIVDTWAGTDDDTLWTTENTVTIHADTEVTVRFRKPKSLLVPSQYHSIVLAVDAANDHGDTIVVDRGTHTANSIDFQGKAITLASQHPDDPDCVAATVIDCAQLGRAFIFQSGEGPHSVVDGFTIRNGSAVYDPTAATEGGGIGTPGADAYGGAVACFNGSSPTLSNLIIENCVAQGQNGEDASFVFDPIPAPEPPADPADPLDPLEPPAEPDEVRDDPNAPVVGEPGDAGLDGAAGADGAPGADGAVGYDGGRGGHGYGGAFYFDPNCAPTILHCTIRNCQAYGGNGGAGGAGQGGGAGADGGDGQAGQGGQDGGPSRPTGDGDDREDLPDGNGGAGGAGGNGGVGGPGGLGGGGGKGGDGGEALGGAIYFGTNCQPTILDCTIQTCETLQGLGNIAGAGGAGGAGGSGGVAADGGGGGSGEADGEDGAEGADGIGANGGDGGSGGAMGINGLRSWGGAIFFAENCDIDILRTAISSHAALSIVATVAYDGGAGGAGGAGGSPGGSGGGGGMGGDGDAAGAGGAGGAPGADGGAGGGGAGGAVLRSITTNFGGANAYLTGCAVRMTDVTISDSLVEVERGGGEYYMSNCTAELTRCSITGNSAGADGGGQAFELGGSITLAECTYSGNSADADGGGLFLTSDCQVDVNDSVFEGNQALGEHSSGGGLYAGGIWDEGSLDFYNGSTVSLRNSEFLGNEAIYGGGLYWYGQAASVDVADCVVWNNTAQHGGGLYWSGGAPLITDCSIRGNNATGAASTEQVPASVPDLTDPTTWPVPGDPNSLTDPNNFPDPNDPNSLYDPDAYPPVQQTLEADSGTGGGLVSWWSDAIIKNCFISENTSRGSGGGVYLGGESVPVLKNCLIKSNTATIGGGGIVSYWDVAPTIASCTIVENTASDRDVADRGRGGGLYASHGSDTKLIDSILWDNVGQQGPQIAIGSDSDPVYIQRPAVLAVSYSDVQGGRAGAHVEPGRTLNWLDGNLNTDPLFVASYFLSQIAADQTQDSPLVDAGSDAAARLGFDAYTTRLDGQDDAGQVDIGFHYPGQGRYQLLVTVIGGHGTVTPSLGYYHEFAEVALTATPDAGYRVREWIGTDNDPGWNQNAIVVTMDTGDKFVIIEFERDVTRTINVPYDFDTLEEAVQAASPGDTNIVLSEGNHYISNPDGIDLQRKAIRIMSKDPNDPNAVANTVIDCAGARFVRKRAFHFRGGEGSDTLITGVTIRNGYWIGEVGITGGIPQQPLNPTDANEPPFRMESGTLASGVAYGGAILCENGSSPTFSKCIIENCIAVGAQGGNGLSGFFIPDGSDVPGFWGGFGGLGMGDSFGGAVACLSGSKPTFVDCTIRNCAARGGMGGDGGHGSQINDGSSYQSWGGDAGDALGDGHGGAVYCEDNSDALFLRCTFANNEATTGITGVPGSQGPGSDLPENDYPSPAGPGSPGDVVPNGTVVGGAVHQNGANPTFVDCTFTENVAFEGFLSTSFTAAGVQQDEVRVYMPGGAIYADFGTTVSLDGCQFERNISSAVYALASCIVDANDCLFRQNEANDENSDTQFRGYRRVIIYGEIYFIPIGGYGDYAGGAMFIGPFCPEVTLKDCYFYSNNASADGGAIRLMSDADLTGCSFSGNKTGGSGGAIDAYIDSGEPENPIVLALNLDRCTFGGNQAIEGYYGVGGALHFRDFEATMTDCYFLNNRAKNGGGLYLASGSVQLSGGSISGNTAVGGSHVAAPAETDIDAYIGGFLDDAGDQLLYNILYLHRGSFSREAPGVGVDVGGGMVCTATEATIEDCMFLSNAVEGVNGSGGAIAFYSGYVDHIVKNCLFRGNTAEREGGAIACTSFSTPIVTHSTFAENTAGRLGGAIFCDWDSDVAVDNSIFQANTKHAIGEEDFANSTVAHTLFYANPDGDFGAYDTVTGQIERSTGADLDVTNANADPLFVEGPLGSVYLSQSTAGQDVNSPAVDAGSDLAENVDLAFLTTRTDGVGDTGAVDLGFHFTDHTEVETFTLTAEVIGGHGTISPASGEFYAGTSVPIVATPEPGWRIAQWAGTTDDASKVMDNLVVIGPDRHVTVEFEQPRTLYVGSGPGEYLSIQRAIDAAEDGDVVLLQPGIYRAAASNLYPWGRIRIHNKDITLTGTSPDDPQAVANTMLSHYRFEILNCGPETVIEGITIGDVNWVGADGASPSESDGVPGVRMVGGTMTVYNASPTIRNCRFVDCSITGGDGGNGDNGNQEHPNGWDGGYAGWAYGGAVYIGFRSNPLFENCLFENCRAIGGNGGNGGNGNADPPGYGGRGGNWMFAESIEQSIRPWWDGWEFGVFDKEGNIHGTVREVVMRDPRGYFDEYWKYSGYGGAVFIDYYSSPRFVDCNFADNATFGGYCGIGGTGPINTEGLPDRNLDVESFGGAVYIGNASDPEFTGCVFTSNTADTNTVSEPDDIYVSYGGAVASENGCRPTFTRCVLRDNDSCVGGGIWFSDTEATIVDCDFADNIAYHGGGLYGVDSTGTVTGTTVMGNLALQASVDPNLTSDPNAPFGGVSSLGGGLCAVNTPIEVYDSVFAENRALSSGGGVYFGGSDQNLETAPSLHNCLIRDNTAGHDGGGISINWYDEPIISSCTIAGNVVSGAFGDAFGGGLYVGYDSNAVMVDSIVWGNISNQEGSQIAVMNTSQYGPRPSALRVSYSDIQPDVDPSTITSSAMDLVFVIDSTDSMTLAVNAIEAAAADIVAAGASLVPDFRMAVVDFKDFNDTSLGAASDYPFRVVTQFTEDPARIINGLNSIGTPAGAGGGTVAESTYTALWNTIEGTALGGWRGGDVSRVIILISDGPPHDPEPPTGLTLGDVVRAASTAPNKRIFSVNAGQSGIAAVYLATLAGGTGGAMVQADALTAIGTAALDDENPIADAVIETITGLNRVGSSIFVSGTSKLSGWDAATGLWDPITGNIQDDPLFIAGYYLSQVESGQGRQSPAVDAGSGPANARTIALSDLTTRTDAAYDVNTVDMGYHYVAGVTLLTLTAEVLPDADDGLIHGTVAPTYTLIYEGAAEDVIRLVAIPEEGYSVAQWTGTDDDTSTALINTVTLTQDTHVTVSFEKRKSRVVTVPGDYPRIQDAVMAAGEGDTIVVDPGTYYSGYEGVALYIDRSVTITSRNPDDPDTVAATVIDGLLTLGNGWNNLGVVFTEGAGRSTVFNGFTIQNCGGRASDGEDGDRDEGHPSGYDGVPIQGGGMVILPGASPVIKNCIFRNNMVIAGDGGAGVDADETMNAGRGGWGGWARGGAIYCAADSSPKFINCLVEGNSAEGGNGGNGGNWSEDGGLANYGGNFTPSVPVNIDPDGFGSEGANLELWRLWPWDFAAGTEASFGTLPYSPATGISGGTGSYFGDYRWYSGYGGGIYIDQNSKVEFVSCTIRDNRTFGGMSGQGGEQGTAGRFTEPLVPFELPTYGGGVYCAAQTEVTFTECTFADNVTSPGIAGQDPNFRLDPYIGYGGGIAAEGTATLMFIDCNFVDNVADTGGGLYVINSDFTAIDCNIASNDAMRGGGLAGMAGTIRITGGTVMNNRAIQDVDDPNDDDILPMGAGILCSTATAFIQDCNLVGNLSEGSGGAIYLRGQNASSIFNCLIHNNRAIRDGGGISTNWYAEPTIRNCTFTGNAAFGIPGQSGTTGLGGAVFCGYLSEATVIDSILWKNFAIQGAELAVGTGFELDPQCGTLHVSYSDVGPGPNSVFIDDSCSLVYGEGIINMEPLFADGPLGSFYLSNREVAGQSLMSPAVDTGSDFASAVGMSRYTTRTDRQPDTGLVDMGFHYSFLEPCRFCDLVFDGIIRFDDFAMFAQQWLNESCSEIDGWCSGVDFTYDSQVDARDLAILADCWMVEDTTAPTPDRAEWETPPYLSGGSATMIAVEALDAWWGDEVEYRFENVYGNGHSSQWQSSRVYTDSGLSSNMEYGYTVTARDPLGNETAPSTIRFASGADRKPPTPEPLIDLIAANSSQSITMTATISVDDNLVQYFFDTNTPSGHDSGWIDTPDYTDIDLLPATVYCYRVKARDLSSGLNETEYSEFVCVSTDVPADSNAPVPNPMAFDPNGLPREYDSDGSDATRFDYVIEMMAAAATDDSGVVEYFFECQEEKLFNSGWQTDPIYTTGPVGRQGQAYHFRVQARDASGNVTEWSGWVQAGLRPEQAPLTVDPGAGGAVGGGLGG